MRNIGVSVYPENTELEKNKNYLKKAAELGYSRVFTCLISVGNQGKNGLENFKKLIDYCNQLGLDVIADVNPKIINQFDISYDNLDFFSELGLYGLRMDLGYTGQEESIMSYDSNNLKIELNMSSGIKHLERIIEFCPKRENLIACHNFYPQKYTGLSRKYFLHTSRNFKKYNIRTAAFVSAKSASFGPWPLDEGLPTLEEHRNLPIQVQAKDLFNTGLIDDVIISNAFASQEELEKMAQVNRDKLELTVELEEGLPELQRKIILDEFHFNRGDISSYLIRSTQPRVKYKDKDIEPYNSVSIKKGDILLCNQNYNRYAGELQIALQDMKNPGKKNVVGSIVSDEIFLIDKIKPWQKFSFKEN